MSAADNSNLFLPENLTLEAIGELLDSAFIRYIMNEDSLYVTESHRFWITPPPGNNRVVLSTYFEFDPSSDLEARQSFVNKINDSLIVIRASIPPADLERLYFDYSIPIEGGITKRAFVFAVKLFNDIIGSALRLDRNDLLK